MILGGHGRRYPIPTMQPSILINPISLRKLTLPCFPMVAVASRPIKNHPWDLVITSNGHYGTLTTVSINMRRFHLLPLGYLSDVTPSGLHEYRCAVKTLSMMITLWLKLLWSSSSRHRGRKSKVFQFLTLPLGYSKAMSMPLWGVSWAQISLVFKWEARSGPHWSTWGHHTFG